MIEIPEANKRIADEYRDALRKMKRTGISLDDMPEDVGKSMLALHQNALAVYWAEELNRREQAKCGTSTS